MKVCFVASSSGRGGSDIALLELLDSLRKQSIDCFVFLPSNGHGLNVPDAIKFSRFPFRGAFCVVQDDSKQSADVVSKKNFIV